MRAAEPASISQAPIALPREPAVAEGAGTKGAAPQPILLARCFFSSLSWGPVVNRLLGDEEGSPSGTTRREDTVASWSTVAQDFLDYSGNSDMWMRIGVYYYLYTGSGATNAILTATSSVRT